MLPSISTEGLDYNLMKRVHQFDKIVWGGDFGVAWHRGSICATNPAAPSSNLA